MSDFEFPNNPGLSLTSFRNNPPQELQLQLQENLLKFVKLSEAN